MTIMNRTADAWRSTQARPTTRRMLGASALAVVIAGFTQAAAAATDTKDYSGAACVSEGQQPATFLIDRQGGLSNGGSGNAIVLCPVVRDLKRISSAQVRLKRNDVGTISCALATVNSNGSFENQQFLSTPFGPPAKVQLNFTSQLPPSTGVGTYSLECNLPPTSNISGAAGILMYRIVESD
jgi:hypothetical protein